LIASPTTVRHQPRMAYQSTIDDPCRVAHSFVLEFQGEDVRRSFLSIVCLVAFSGVLCAQSTDASLSGRVTDASKARIVAARITIVSLDTNIQYQTQTNSVGEYFLTSIPPGRYRIEVEKPEFKKLVKPDVILHVQDALNFDFEIQVGPASETIRVESG